MSSPTNPIDSGQHLTVEELADFVDRRRAGHAPSTGATGAHLALCLTCQRELDELALTVDLLSALPELAPRRSFALTPDDVAGAKGGAAARSNLRWVWPVRWASVAATLLFALTVGLEAGTQPVALPSSSQSGGAAALVTVIARTTAEVAATRGAAGASPDRASGATTRGAPQTAAQAPAPSEVQAFGLTPTVFPTPTAVPAPVVVAPVAQPGVPWRTLETGVGAVALVLAALGFAVPPLVRRRDTAASV